MPKPEEKHSDEADSESAETEDNSSGSETELPEAFCYLESAETEDNSSDPVLVASVKRVMLSEGWKKEKKPQRKRSTSEPLTGDKLSTRNSSGYQGITFAIGDTEDPGPFSLTTYRVNGSEQCNIFDGTFVGLSYARSRQ